MYVLIVDLVFFFFNDTATTEIYTLSLHDALPISSRRVHGAGRRPPESQRPRAGRVRAQLAALVAVGVASADGISLASRGGRRPRSGCRRRYRWWCGTGR